MKKTVKKTIQFMSLTLFLFLLLTLLIPYLGFVFAGKAYDNIDKQSIKVIAHRGASGYAPENTLVSFSKALDMHVDIVELDVHLTADDSVIVMHDHKVDRTTNGKGAIREMTFAQLRQLDAGKWFNDSFAGEKVPTLSEVLALVDGRAKVLIELKWPAKGLYPGLVEKVMGVVAQHQAESWIILQSFESSYLVDAFRQFPAIEQQQLIFGKSGLIPFYFDRTPHFGVFQPLQQAKSVNAFYLYAQPKFIKEMHKLGKTVYAFTPNKPDQMMKLLHLGVDGLITNYPDRALRLLGR